MSDSSVTDFESDGIATPGSDSENDTETTDRINHHAVNAVSSTCSQEQHGSVCDTSVVSGQSKGANMAALDLSDQPTSSMASTAALEPNGQGSTQAVTVKSTEVVDKINQNTQTDTVEGLQNELNIELLKYRKLKRSTYRETQMIQVIRYELNNVRDDNGRMSACLNALKEERIDSISKFRDSLIHEKVKLDSKLKARFPEICRSLNNCTTVLDVKTLVQAIEERKILLDKLEQIARLRYLEISTGEKGKTLIGIKDDPEPPTTSRKKLVAKRNSPRNAEKTRGVSPRNAETRPRRRITESTPASSSRASATSAETNNNVVLALRTVRDR